MDQAEAQVLKVNRYGDLQICTLFFKSDFVPFSGMVLTSDEGLVIKIKGIVISKKMLEGIYEHPNAKNIYDCNYEIVSKGSSSLEEGMRFYYPSLMCKNS